MASPEPGFRGECEAALADRGIRLRRALEADLPALVAIYAATREQELSIVPWSAAQKDAFVRMQSQAQEHHYALHHPGFERLLLEEGALGAIGRIYVDTTPSSVHLMDIAILPARRGAGLGTRLMEALLRYADARGLPIELHVEPDNPARRMYLRLGFVAGETAGFYQRMVRPAAS